MKINLSNHSLETLQKGFINAGSRGGKIGEDELKVIADDLEKIVAGGGTFTVATVAKLIKDKKLANYDNNTHPEQSRKTAARKALISLGVIKQKAKEPKA